jgi:hypothetical protein
MPDRSSVISGEIQAGGNSICLCLTGVLLWPPRRLTFHDSYPIDVSHLSFNFLCLLLLYVYRWGRIPAQETEGVRCSAR